MCRSILIYTPNQLPRSLLTFPFAKNRIADAAVTAMVDQLTAQVEGAGIVKLCEDMEQTKGGIKTDCESPLAVWRVGGSSSIEWLERREYVFKLSVFDPVSPNITCTTVYSERADVCTSMLRCPVCTDIFSQRKWIILVGTGPPSLLTSSS